MTRSSPSPPDDAVALLRDLAAAPRPTGSATIAAARARVAAELRAIGFDVREEAFEFSAWPGRYGTPAVASGVAVVAALAGHVGARGGGATPLVILAAGMTLLGAAAMWLTRKGVLALPVTRVGGVNLVATRPEANPQVWLCAHLDSKSQPIPSLLRMAGVTLAGIGLLALAGLAVASAARITAPFAAWGFATAVTLLGAAPVVLTVVGSRSPGALDNASGVAAVIDAARALHGIPVGVLITDAEELGLAGAHAWAQGNRGSVVLNCDGVDDGGDDVVMYAGKPPRRLLDAARGGAVACGRHLTVRRMPLGLLTDSVAFSMAGGESITFSRGNFASLSRVHRPHDSLDRLSGASLASTGSLIAATARDLLRSQAWKS